MPRARQILIVAVCVLSGVAIGNMIGRITMASELREAVEGLKWAHAGDMESDAKKRLLEIDLIQRGKVDTVLRMNCMFLRSAVRHLDPNDYPDRIAEVQRLIQQATAKLAELENSGQCPRKEAAP